MVHAACVAVLHNGLTNSLKGQCLNAAAQQAHRKTLAKTLACGMPSVPAAWSHV
jgi:hypothetical protein